MSLPAGTTASWLAVRRPPLLVPLVAAALLLLVAVRHDGHGSQIVHGVAVLAAAALAVAVDDPAGEVADATATTRRVRTLARLGVAAALALPVLGVVALTVELRSPATPMAPLLVTAAGWALAVTAIGCALRRWRGTTSPAYPTVLGLVLLTVGLQLLPQSLTMIDPQPWGPPWEGALWRWAGLGLLLVAVLVAALRDPAEGDLRGRGRGR